jgi:hypothetical protein
MSLIHKQDRRQVQMLSLESMIPQDHAIRVIDQLYSKCEI